MKNIRFLFVVFGVLFFAAGKVVAEPYFCPPEGYKYDSSTAYTYLYDTEKSICEQYRMSSNISVFCGMAMVSFHNCRVAESVHKKRYQSGKCQKIDIKYIDEPDCKGYVYLIKGTNKLVDRFMTSGGDACVAKIKAMYPKSND